MEFINGKWRTNDPTECRPEELDGTTTLSGTTVSTTILGGLTTSGASDTVDWSTYYIPSYPYIWYPCRGWIFEEYEEESDYQVLNWSGRTIIYRFLTNSIEYAIVKRNQSVDFTTADNLEEVLRLLR
jgi:hypothetical protein